MGRTLEVDYLLTVPDCLGALAVGDAANKLVGDVNQDQDAELAPGVTPALGQLGSDAGEGTRHGTGIVSPRLTGHQAGVAGGSRRADTVPAMSWRRPDKRRVRAIRDRLREMYEQPVNEPHGHPIAELIKTVLSQHTNDRNRDRAFAALRERFPLWEEVRDAPVEAVEEAIRPGGLAKQKAPRIQAILEQLGEHPSLDWTKTAPPAESMAYLDSLPGVGRKTAACVLMFSWGIPEIPVDVHVHRVGGRLGLFPARASFERAHDEMQAVVDPADAYELHMNLIRHGRQVCRPKPRCGECELRRMCPWYRAGRK